MKQKKYKIHTDKQK